MNSLLHNCNIFPLFSFIPSTTILIFSLNFIISPPQCYYSLLYNFIIFPPLPPPPPPHFYCFPSSTSSFCFSFSSSFLFSLLLLLIFYCFPSSSSFFIVFPPPPPHFLLFSLLSPSEKIVLEVGFQIYDWNESFYSGISYKISFFACWLPVSSVVRILVG